MTIDGESLRARTAIFGRLRAPTMATIAKPSLPAVTGWRRQPPIAAGTTLIEAFRRNASGWRAEIIDAGPDDWPVIAANVLRENELLPAVAGHDSEVARQLRQHLGPHVLACPDEDMDQIKPALFDQFGVGVVGTVGGIAETGSLILWPSASEPRSLSLIPPVCLAVLFASRLFPDFDSAMHELDWAHNLPSNALLVTGPSKTADIQRLLVYGAHGPRRLLIVLVDDTGAAA